MKEIKIGLNEITDFAVGVALADFRGLAVKERDLFSLADKLLVGIGDRLNAKYPDLTFEDFDVILERVMFAVEEMAIKEEKRRTFSRAKTPTIEKWVWHDYGQIQMPELK